MRSALLFALFTVTLLTLSCRKDDDTSFATGASLDFSTDTVFLDTVFADLGSSTRNFKVYNRNNEKVNISSIRLGNGQSSFYRLNVDGISGKSFNNIEIESGDSLFVFVEITPNVAGALDLLYIDSIMFNTGGSRTQSIELVTLAKDAVFHFPNASINLGGGEFLPVKVLNCNEVWDNTRPHVVYGYALVPQNCDLTISAGTQVHFHKDAGILVFDGGRLLVNGQVGNIVEFQGDRLEPSFEDVPGQWGGIFGGIFINSQAQSTITNAEIRNSTIAIRVDSTGINDPENLILENVLIKNASRVGLFGGFSNILAQNLVIGNTGLYNFFAIGGSYHFQHSTFANYWDLDNRNTPSIFLSNQFESRPGVFLTRELGQATFENCIVYGDLEAEVQFDENNSDNFNYFFDHVLMRLPPNPMDNSYDLNEPTHFNTVDNLYNIDPSFRNVGINNFRPDSIPVPSPAIDAGDIGVGAQVPLDIDGNPRGGVPDLGAYEADF